MAARQELRFPGQLSPFTEDFHTYGLAFSADSQSLLAASHESVRLFRSTLVPDTSTETLDVRVKTLYFVPATRDQFEAQQIVLTTGGSEKGQDLAALPIGYPLALTQESSQTSLYVRPLHNLPPEASFLAQVDTSRTTVALIFDLPIFAEYEARIIAHFPNGTQSAPIQHTDFPGRQVGLSALIEQLTLEGLSAERLSGTWLYSPAQEPFLSKEDHYAVANWTVAWNPLPFWLTLRCQQDNVLFEIVVWPEKPPSNDLAPLDPALLDAVAAQMIRAGPYPRDP